jgi:hypothetical protein
MGNSTTYAIPINLVLAAIVAAVFTGSKSEIVLESDIPLLGIALALIIQEILLVQWLSSAANVSYTKRLIGSQISVNKRIAYLTVPFISIIVIGILLFLISNREISFIAGLRILSVSIILTLCADPLIGLKDKGPVAILGAGLAYLVVLNAGVSGHQRTADFLEIYLPGVAGNALVVGVLCYLVLSCRWTYYRLFCFEEMYEWKRSAIDTFIPFAIMAIGATVQLFAFFTLLFTGQ